MKIIKNFFLIISGLITSLIMVEIFLIINGKYSKLTKKNLKPSISVFERPNNIKLEFIHPDINTKHYLYYDNDGVKNTSNTTTLLKKNIIGFFGDSFTENVGVHEKYDLVNIINESVSEYNLVNYGIEGFSIDQVFLRYLKYEHHDIRKVIYICHTDDYPRYDIIRNIDENGYYELNKYEFSLLKKIISKINLSYLILELYYKLKLSVYKDQIFLSGIDLENKIKSIFSNSIISDALKNNDINKIDTSKKVKLENDFIDILRLFNKVVKKSGRDFYVFVYPSSKNIDLFKNEKLEDIKIFYLKKNVTQKKFKFLNDGHWNEMGNLEVSKQILNILGNEKILINKNNLLNLHEEIKKIYE